MHILCVVSWYTSSYSVWPCGWFQLHGLIWSLLGRISSNHRLPTVILSFAIGKVEMQMFNKRIKWRYIVFPFRGGLTMVPTRWGGHGLPILLTMEHKSNNAFWTFRVASPTSYILFYIMKLPLKQKLNQKRRSKNYKIRPPYKTL